MVIVGGIVWYWVIRPQARPGAGAGADVVSHRLPLRAEPNPAAPHGFDFSIDADALPLQLSRGLPRPLVFVGALPVAAASIPGSDELAADLLDCFSCSPVFLDPGLHRHFYDGFCERYMLHYLLPPLTPSCGGDGLLSFDSELYRSYLTANTEFADRVLDLLRLPDECGSCGIGSTAASAYHPIVVIDDPLETHEKLAFYAMADVCVATAVRDGLNTTPYVYTVCRQEGQIIASASGAPRESAIVLSEFAGCSPSLSGAVRVNPWNVDEVAEGMSSALTLKGHDKQMRQEKHYKFVITRDIPCWGRSLDQDLQRATMGHASMNILSGSQWTPLLCRTTELAADGRVLMPKELIDVLNELCSDPKNTVFLVSGQGKEELARWFAPCERLGICAEHGYFTRDSPWESPNLMVDFDWKNIVEYIMKHYSEVTGGSYIEAKETSLAWHYEDADPDFGSCQSRELQDHLLNLLAQEPVSVIRGHEIVEVIPQEVGKGTAVRGLLAAMGARGSMPDFVLCVGDDEDMFEAITAPSSMYALPLSVETFTCTIGNEAWRSTTWKSPPMF
ncbi:LOW QUALITY PROTEIN: hypothetical protein U9M48_003764 [Paspalum notatum var. saurae]|uniref:Trehalose-phosphatase n=1 Tax=Paspalum notatum var. saurae TaxID=547442 RepID=A0AAQ3PNL3_PASNO